MEHKELYCHNCGAPLDENQTFCIRCGYRVEEKELDEIAKDSSSGSCDANNELDSTVPERTEVVDLDEAEHDDNERDVVANESTCEDSSDEDSEPCPNCGALLPLGQTFCIHCGQRLGNDNLKSRGVEDGTTSNIPVVTPTPVSSPPSPQSTYQPNTSPQRHRMSGGALAGIIVGCAAAVLVVGFGLFYFINPFGLTEGIFSNSAAAQAARAEEERIAAEEEAAQAAAEAEEAKKAQEQAEKKRKEAEAAQQEAEEAQRKAEENAKDLDSNVVVYSNGDMKVMVDGQWQWVPNNNGCIIPDSDRRLITSSDLVNKTDLELWIARNEIYARHGTEFKTPDLQRWFSVMYWYYPTSSPSSLSDLENRNVETIQKEEARRGSPYAV